jgi:hypothetical protein
MIEDALLYPDSTRILTSFRDIQKSELYVCTHKDNKEEFFLITKSSKCGHEVLERISSPPSGLYYTYIKPVPYVASKMIFQIVDTFSTCHSPLKIHAESLRFFERIQVDICDSIQPLCDSFRYFMVLIDTSIKWSHMCLLSTHNHAFSKFMMQVVRLKMNYHEYRIKSIQMDNVAKFSFRAFNDYCMAQRI